MASGELNFGFLPINKKIRLPLAVMKGKEEGTTCFISGGVHGDEINGPRLVELVMHSLDPKKLKGTIIFLPIVNITGFHYKQRHVFEDDKDLNRCFLFRGKSISYKMAKVIFDEIIRKCDFGIDCHDSGKRDILLPHSRVHRNETGEHHDGCTIDMGKILGTRIIMRRGGDRGMMAIESFKRLKKPVLTVEVGGGMVLWDDFLQEGLRGIRNVLIYNGMIKGKIKLPKEQFLISDVNRFNYTSNREGLLYKKVRLGDYIHKDDLIAVIFDPINKQTERVHSKHCGFVFSLKMQDKVDEDEVIVSILQKTSCSEHKTSEQKGFTRIIND